MDWTFEELAGLLIWVADSDALYARVEELIEAKAAWGTYVAPRAVGVRELAESEWQDRHHADYLAAEEWTRGHMVRPASAARGITAEDLWVRGDWERHASEEMAEWFALFGRWGKRAFLLAFYAQHRAPETVEETREAEEPAMPSVRRATAVRARGHAVDLRGVARMLALRGRLAHWAERLAPTCCGGVDSGGGWGVRCLRRQQ